LPQKKLEILAVIYHCKLIKRTNNDLRYELLFNISPPYKNNNIKDYN